MNDYGKHDLPLNADLLTLRSIILDLQNAPALIRQEFVEQLFYCKEFSVEIKADSTVFDTRDFRGLLFSIY